MIHPKLWPIKQQILKRSAIPILCGPFRGEVGFEALYWIPFLKRFAKSHGIDTERLIPVTRGGMGKLYGMGEPIELYGLRTPQDIRVENRVQHAKHQQLKQTHWVDFDRKALADAAKVLRLDSFLTLHPGWMFQRLNQFFLSETGPAALEREAFFEPLTVPAPPDDLVLPEKFVAVRFYHRYTFPMHPQLIEFAQESIRQIAKGVPVILLNSGIHADDHIDVAVKDTENVYKLTDLCDITPQNNLAAQASVIGRALGFVGTYGGLAQLALRLGKPSVSYYQEWGGTAMAHKHLADAIALQRNLPHIVQKVGEIPLMQTVMPLFKGVQTKDLTHSTI